MTDDEILAAAKRISARRRNDARFAAFMSKEQVMIRWDVPHKAGLNESSASVMVSREAVQDLVRASIGELSDG